MGKKIFGLLLFSFFVLSCLTATISGLTKDDFPPDFIFGAGSAAYQYEGAAYEDGKGESIWDHFLHQYPDKVQDYSNGDVALDFYHKYKEDVQRLVHLGVNTFRFSMSWPRIVPTGKVSEGINEKGVEFYNNLIDELLANNITPFATIWHWDLPYALQAEYCGFLSPLVIEDFKNYADLLFKLFGDRVKHWTTVNEPNLSTKQGYNSGYFAPGRCSKWEGNCTTGNSGFEPYVVVHHQLLCHAVTVNLYRTKYQPTQNGMIGFSIATDWNFAIDHKPASRQAAQRVNDFLTGWFLEPTVYGRYPKNMVEIVGDRLPKFTPEQSQLLKGSFDFVGLNYYTSNFVYETVSATTNLSYTGDWGALQTQISHSGEAIGEETCLSWLYIYPQGIHDLLTYVKEKYGNPPIIITENGMADANNASLSLEEALNDTQRISYHKQHLEYLHKAIKEDGVNVLGYFVWSFLDDFEWYSGYTIRFGLHYVDFKTLERYPKASVSWFREEFFLKPNTSSAANSTSTSSKDEL
ncbi:hypothetical protein Dimus_034221 [Dionaea muscipula]